MASTKVVLPWSTWATMATFLRSWRSSTVHQGSDRFGRPELRGFVKPCSNSAADDRASWKVGRFLAIARDPVQGELRSGAQLGVWVTLGDLRSVLSTTTSADAVGDA